VSSGGALTPIERANPRGLPRGLATLSVVLAAVGALAFLAGLAQDAASAWRAFHVNYLFFAGLAQGGAIVSCVLVTVGARWPGPVRRIAEAMAAWVPISFVLGAFDFLGRDHIYPWIAEPVPAKALWLSLPRVAALDLAILGILAVVTTLYLYHSLRPTLHGVAATAQGRVRGLLEWWTAGWRGDAEERERSETATRRIAPGLILLFAFGFSFLAFDQVMSLTPTWYANLFGAYFTWGAFLSAISATALLSVLHRNTPGLEGEITKARMHDQGKMIFAFSIFWMYLFWAQYLVTWYGNLPEETQFFSARLGPQFLTEQGSFAWYWNFSFARMNASPYGWLSMVVWACCWIVPFWVLLGVEPKKTPLILGGVSFVVVLGFWLERNLLVWPSLAPTAGASWVGPIQFGIAAGFLGAFSLVYLVFTRVFPGLAVPSRH
jgi:hypothetical protein